MNTRSIVLSTKTAKILKELGLNIKLARLRRKLSSEMISERADITRTTLNSIEKGLPTVRIGAYLKVLTVFGLESDVLKVAQDDILGRKLQDAKILTRLRAPKDRKTNE